MAAVVTTGMSKAEMKKLLTRSKEEPVHCAVGMGDNAALALLMLHRSKQGRAVEAILKEACPDAKNTRFGTAFVDIDDNPKLVKFTLNRAVSGIAKRLVKTLKKTGFTKVQILTEDGSAMESFEEEDEEAEEGAPAAPGAGAAAEAPAPSAIPKAPPRPPAGPTAEDRAAKVAAMTRQLAALAATIPGSAGTDAGRKAMLMKLATDANVNLKTGNLTYAANFLLQLKKALDGAPASPANGLSAEPVAGNMGLAKSRLAWVGARQQVESDIGKLRAALTDAYGGQEVGGEVLKRYQAKVAPVLAQFDDRLLDAIDGLMNEADAAARAAKLTEAKAAVKDCLSFAMTDKLVAELDANPFVPLAIRGTATKALAGLATAMQ